MVGVWGVGEVAQTLMLEVHSQSDIISPPRDCPLHVQRCRLPFAYPALQTAMPDAVPHHHRDLKRS
jgi:hypothetical protein